MLVGLVVRDVVLIDQLALQLGSGLCVLTGETGAGKSILLDALGLALGMRSDAALVRPGAERASVVAEFEVPGEHSVAELLAEYDLPCDGTLILRRSVAKDGRSRAYVNDLAVSVATLKALGECLVEIHGQHDARGLLSPGRHRSLLDVYAGHGDLVARCRAAHAGWRRASEALDEARLAQAKAKEDEDYLRHALEELQRLEPETGEESALGARRAMLKQAEKIVAAINDARDSLEGADGVDERLRDAQRSLERIADDAGGNLDKTLSALDRAAGELASAGEALAAATRAMDLDIGQLEPLEDRLFALKDLSRKHRVPVDDLADLARRIAARLTTIDDSAARIEALQNELEATLTGYTKTVHALTASRRKAARRLDKAVAKELPPLGLEKARFATEIESTDVDDGAAEGVDRVHFTIATLADAAPGPLQRVASGGELSRIMLALNVVLAGRGAAVTMIFDEVDAGVGGATAARVGERLQRLSQVTQVLLVTHLPQVAALADHHWQISKTETGAETTARVIALDDAAREEEVARMLSGTEITREARAAAASLLRGQPS